MRKTLIIDFKVMNDEVRLAILACLPGESSLDIDQDDSHVIEGMEEGIPIISALLHFYIEEFRQVVMSNIQAIPELKASLTKDSIMIMHVSYSDEGNDKKCEQEGVWVP